MPLLIQLQGGGVVPHPPSLRVGIHEIGQCWTGHRAGARPSTGPTLLVPDLGHDPQPQVICQELQQWIWNSVGSFGNTYLRIVEPIRTKQRIRAGLCSSGPQVQVKIWKCFLQ